VFRNPGSTPSTAPFSLKGFLRPEADFLSSLHHHRYFFPLPLFCPRSAFPGLPPSEPPRLSFLTLPGSALPGSHLSTLPGSAFPRLSPSDPPRVCLPTALAFRPSQGPPSQGYLSPTLSGQSPPPRRSRHVCALSLFCESCIRRKENLWQSVKGKISV